MQTPDPLVLALDGSTRVCSAALLRPTAGCETGWEVMSRRAKADGRGQARALLGLVDEMLEQVSGMPRDLAAVVVGTGPGTFTGVRITVATARALSLALSVPVLGVSTLAALAAGSAGAQPGCRGGATPMAEVTAWLRGASTMMPVVDARRGQVFYGLYEKPAGGGSRHHAWVRRGAYGVCDRGSLALVLQAHGARDTVILAERQGLLDEVPSGARVIEADVYAEHLVIGQDALEEPGVMPLGKSLGPWLRVGLARSIFERGAATAVGESTEGLGVGAVGSPESVTPIYVRSPDADLHIQKMKDPWADDNAT